MPTADHSETTGQAQLTSPEPFSPRSTFVFSEVLGAIDSPSFCMIHYGTCVSYTCVSNTCALTSGAVSLLLAA
jgi:hypothetical protein